MRKTIVYILVLGILAFGVWYFLFKDANIFGEDEAGFNISNTTAIHKIFLANQRGDTISLQKTGDGWMVNGRYPASKRMTETLLQTFKEQFAAYPVPENAHNSVIKSLSGQAIKVEVYDKDGKPVKVFYVGGQVNGNKGTYMLIDGAERPYVVQLPVFEGYVTPRYSTELKDWRDRTVVDLAPEQLASVEIKYLSEDEYLNSFTMVRKDDGSFTVNAHPELKISGELNKRRVAVFAGFFQKVGCEGFLNGIQGLDSIIANAKKRCEITIIDKKGNNRHIDLYWMPTGKRSKNLATSSEGIPDEYDADRFYGVINNNKDTVILQNYTFDKMFRKGYEFYAEDGK